MKVMCFNFINASSILIREICKEKVLWNTTSWHFAAKNGLEFKFF